MNEKGYLYDKDGATWFRSTDFGDDKDRVLLKENGEYTYFMSDVPTTTIRCSVGSTT